MYKTVLARVFLLCSLVTIGQSQTPTLSRVSTNTESKASGSAGAEAIGRGTIGNELPPSLEIRGSRLFVKLRGIGAQVNQLAELTASDGQANDQFGHSVSVSANTVVVGAWNATVGGVSEQGAAYVFVKPESGWANMTETAKLTASDGAMHDLFGGSVSISGNTVLVGSEEATVGSNVWQGAAYVFVEPPTGWGSMTETAKLTAQGEGRSSFFGSSVAISGNTISVGSPGNGTAFVFVKPGSGWITTSRFNAKLKASDAVRGNGFGSSVAISGTTVAVAAPAATVGSNVSQGAAYVFVRPTAGWVNTTQTAKLVASDGMSGDSLGFSISISANTVAAGAPFASGGSGPGAAYVFVEPTSGWVNMDETAKLTASDGQAGDAFGLSVAVGARTVMVGAPDASVNGTRYQGTAYVYDEPKSGWTTTSKYVAKLTASNGAQFDGFANSAAISGGTLAAGASSASGGEGPGAAYVFGP